MLHGRADTDCARAGRVKRVQQPCVERERSTYDLSHRYSHGHMREVVFASPVWPVGPLLDGVDAYGVD